MRLMDAQRDGMETMGDETARRRRRRDEMAWLGAEERWQGEEIIRRDEQSNGKAMVETEPLRSARRRQS